MTLIALLGGFVAGAAVMAVYNLTHGDKVSKLGAHIMGELAKIKDHIGLK